MDTASAAELPYGTAEILEALCCGQIRRSYPIQSAINHVALVETTKHRLLLKWRFDPPLEMFQAERDGLARLANENVLRVPAVVGAGYWEPVEPYRGFSYLVMDYIPNRKARDQKVFSRRFAHGLAALHHCFSETGEYGWDEDNFFGAQPQRNRQRTKNWPDFYRDHRLLPQIECARQLGHLTSEREWALMRVVEKLPALLERLPPEASLIHGDLSQGNFLCAAVGEDPVLLNPSVYFAPREMEIAHLELLGGFPPRFRENYEAAFPLDDGYQHRRCLHQIYPLLIRLNHFGEQYGSHLDYACRQYP